MRRLTWKIFAKLIPFLIVFFAFLSASAGIDRDSLKQVLASIKQRDRAEMLNNLALKIMEDDPGQAKLYAAEVLENALESGNLQEEARAQFLLAELAVTMGDHAGAIGYYEQSAAIEKRTMPVGWATSAIAITSWNSR